MHRDALFGYVDDLLQVSRFRDYCPNGIQVEGRAEVGRVALGVSFSAALLDRAIEWNADAIMVHHGTFWKNEPRVLRGFRRNRMRRLLNAEITLAGYHLPLDAHMEYGNNVQIARAIGLEEIAAFGESGGTTIGCRGRFRSPIPPQDVRKRIAEACGGETLAFLHGRALVESVGIISGGSGMMVDQAIDAGLDFFLCGEPAEPAMATSSEAGIHYVAAGHYRTETFGVKALGAHLTEKFGVETHFFEIPNPV